MDALGQISVLVAELTLVSALVLALFRLRSRMGLTPLHVTLGVFQPVQVVLAASLYVEVAPGFALSPGSVVMFSATLFAILLVYIREDATEVRRVIYAVLLANVTTSVLLLVFGWHLRTAGTQDILGLPPDLFPRSARVMAVGTLVLVADVVLLIVLYETVRRWFRRALFPRLLVTLAVLLALDSVAFAIGAFAGEPQFLDVLVPGLVGKLGAGVLLTVFGTLYLRRVEPDVRGATLEGLPLRDVFVALTYKEKYEIARRSARARHAAILDATMDGVLALGPGGEVVEANDAALALFGWDRGALLGKDPVEALVAPEERDRVRALLAAVARDGLRLTPGETRGLRAGGEEFPAELAAAAADLEEGRLVVVSVRDVGRSKRLQELLDRKHRLDGVGRLAGGVAHDFNNILTVIQGNAQLLEDSIDASSELRPSIEAIVDASYRAGGLTSRLLSLSRKHQSPVETYDVGEANQALSGLLRRVLGEEVRIVVESEEGEHVVRQSRHLLEHGLINLAVNARDAMPRGGTLTISTGTVELDEGDDVLPAGRYVRVTVSDTGEGMPPEVRARAFEPFFTTKGERGTGLGLSTTRGVIRDLGGDLRLRPAEGRGTTLEVWLPAARATDGEAETDPTPMGSQSSALPPTSRRPVVLVAEDEPQVRGIMARILELAGWEVLVTDGLRAAQAAAEKCERLDLLVSDVVLGDGRGEDLARRVRARHAGAAVLFVSGYSEGRLEPVVSGARFLQKPFTAEGLRDAASEILGEARGTGSGTG